MLEISPHYSATKVYQPLRQDDSLLSSEGAPAALPINDDIDHFLSIDAALERLSMGRFQYQVVVATGLCFAADAMQIILLSFLQLLLQKEWSLTNDQTAFITSILFAGAMVGTLVLGPLADRIGRRPVFFLAASVITCFGMLTATCTNYVALLCAIACVGFGVGGLTIPFDSLAEFLPIHCRGSHLLLIEYFWTLGCLYVVAMAYLCLQNDSGIAHWRWLVVLCSLFSLVALILGYFYVPESPRWLASQGRTDEAICILRKAATVNGQDATCVFPHNMCILPDEETQKASMADLFKPKWRRTTFQLWGAWSGFAFGYYGAIFTITKIFQKEQTNNSSADAFDYTAIFVSSSAELIGTTLVILTIDRMGRISSQVVSYAVAGVSVCLLGILDETNANHNLLVFLGFLTRVFEMSATCVTWVSTAEILTTEIRTTGHSAANAMARIGAFICPFVIQNNRPRTVGIIMLFVHIFTACCVSQLPETMGQSIGASEINRLDDEAHPSSVRDHGPVAEAEEGSEACVIALENRRKLPPIT